MVTRQIHSLMYFEDIFSHLVVHRSPSLSPIICIKLKVTLYISLLWESYASE